MKDYLKCIDESIQKTPALKNKIRQIQQAFENEFADKIYSKKFDYDVNLKDLEKLFLMLNHCIFKDKLSIDGINLIVVGNAAKHNEKGTFKIGVDISNKHVLGIVKYEKDNFFHIVNVLIHEMIHYYDLMYGPLKEKSNVAYVGNVNGRQCVGGEYDAHGKYFKEWCDKANLLGFDVKEKYSIKDKCGMKKILEKKRTTDEFFDKKASTDDEQYRRVKQFYDSLTNCNKDMIYRDAKHWYVQID